MICKNCEKEQGDNFYTGNFVCKPCFRERRYAHRKKHPELVLLSSAKHRAKKEGVPFDLVVEDIVIPEFCPVLGLRLESGYGRGGFSENSPALDKFDPKKGYVRGNISVISFRANRLKGDATLEEVNRLIAWMQNQTTS